MKKSRTTLLSKIMTAKKHDSAKDIKTGQLFVFVGEDPIAYASSCGLDLSVEALDISNKMCGDWAASLAGKKSFTLSCECLLTRKTGLLSYDTLMEKAISGEPVSFFFGEATVTNPSNTGGEFAKNSENKNYTGEALITSISLKSDNGQIASCSVTFTGVGGLTSAGALESAPV